ncbi:MAG: hypothetical protein U5L45_19485 [Saprospiraceae bacterium]|nr:hypothetical protein [Saprospiraceae bacterium]
MVRFSASPKNEPHSPPSRERSEREMQKTLLGYAHSSITIILVMTTFGELVKFPKRQFLILSFTFLVKMCQQPM